MKCPKCGFNSFEFQDNCKKCGVSLASFKMNLNINPVIFNVSRPLAESGQPLSYNAEVPLAEEETGDAFTWEMPDTSDTTSPGDTNFAGFELDFLKQDEKPDNGETAFSFDEEPVSEVPPPLVGENTAHHGDFSFYEETIEPGENQLFNGTAAELPEDGNSLFGETGVIGEIMPEKLQDDVGELDLADIIDDSSAAAEKYEKEFDLGSFAMDGEEAENKNYVVKKDSSDFTDFEKEFESIFQTDETTDHNKPGI
jgi:hypothetical protein